MNYFGGVYPLNMSFYYYGALLDKTQECNCCSHWQVGWGKGDGSDQFVSNAGGMQGYHSWLCVDVWMGRLLGQSMNRQHFMFIWHWYVMAITWEKSKSFWTPDTTVPTRNQAVHSLMSHCRARSSWWTSTTRAQEPRRAVHGNTGWRIPWRVASWHSKWWQANGPNWSHMKGGNHLVAPSWKRNLLYVHWHVPCLFIGIPECLSTIYNQWWLAVVNNEQIVYFYLGMSQNEVPFFNLNLSQI